MSKKKVKEYIRDIEIWKKIGKVAAVYVGIFMLVVMMLRIYTHHGKSIPVPDCKGLMPERAIELAKENHMLLIVTDSIFIDYLPKGCVIDQNPKPGVKVKRNRTIFITTNALNQVKVEVPQVTGLSYRQGKATLEMRGLRVGKLIYKPDFAQNNILQQMYHGHEIKNGTLVEKGESIDLVLGDGFGRSTYPTPSLNGMNYNEAVNEISDGYFNLGMVNYDASIKTLNDTLNAIVWKQKPAYFKGSRSVMGSKIDIWLTIDPMKIPKPDSLNIKN
jgi:beta-lactam-binding protein with PASTA domain